ncbi:MAG: 50S ribosomal protein L25 [Acidobacteriota bacterium]|jgi:large subunit ribosomal protein L25
MSKNVVVDVASRSETGKNVARRMRRSGKIPAVLYGMQKPAVSLTVDPDAIQSILQSESGDNTLFQLRLDGSESKTRHVMIRDRQKDPVSGALVHIDFMRIDLERKVEIEVPLQIVGTATGVKNEGGVLDFIVRTVEVTCLPQDIPESFEVDVSGLHIGQVFRVRELARDPRYEILTEPEQPIVVISAPTVVEEPEAPEAAEGAEEAAAEGEAEGETKASTGDAES